MPRPLMAPRGWQSPHWAAVHFGSPLQPPTLLDGAAGHKLLHVPKQLLGPLQKQPLSIPPGGGLGWGACDEKRGSAGVWAARFPSHTQFQPFLTRQAPSPSAQILRPARGRAPREHWDVTRAHPACSRAGSPRPHTDIGVPGPDTVHSTPRSGVTCRLTKLRPLSPKQKPGPIARRPLTAKCGVTRRPGLRCVILGLF